MTAGAPRFSIVSAVHDVARYLPDFIASIEAQTFDLRRVEVIAVDDGSTDGSLDTLRSWAERRPELVRVLTQENAGQGAARNAGLAVARGEWVTFPDPDDMIDADYLTQVDDAIGWNDRVRMVATNHLLLNDLTGRVTNSHPLRWHFGHGGRVVDLDERSRWFVGTVACAFFRLTDIRSQHVTFDGRIRPNFEDGHFCASYLLTDAAPLVAFVPAARYLYRKRGDGTSALERAGADPRRFTDVIEHGYLGLVETATERLGRVPEWLQNQLLYGIQWLFRLDDSGRAAPVFADRTTVDRFHALMTRLLGRLSPDVIATFSVVPVKPEWQHAMLHGMSTPTSHTSRAVVDRTDLSKREVRVVHRYGGPAPDAQYLVNGRAVEPTFAKTRAIDHFGRTVLYERIAWVTARGHLRVRLDGEPVPVTTSWDSQLQLDGLQLLRQEAAPLTSIRPSRPSLARVFAHRHPARRVFRDAWVLMDRIHKGGDNAETLFRHLRTERPDVNAWFVVERGTPTWRRLRKLAGHRVVAHGSRRWAFLMANARYLISSHADGPIVHPVNLPRDIPRTWKFIYLRHGVSLHNMSRWLNTKPIDLFITTTRPEYDSIVADDGPYATTAKEVALTGLTRFDELWRKAQDVGPDQRDLILVAPTWRPNLVKPTARGSQRRHLSRSFLTSEFVERWMEFLCSPELERAAQEAGATVGFLPHPNLQDALDLLDLPPHIRTFRYDDGDVQLLFARSAVLVTDYSSVAFDAAFVGRPVTYFQFDASTTFSGGHAYGRGYFSYERDGFGPVTSTADETIAAVRTALANGPEPMEPYRSRAEAAFAFRDDRACERVTAAVEAMGQRG